MRKNYLLLLALAFLFPFHLKAQIHDWVISCGDLDQDIIYNVQVDNIGNVYVVGEFSGTVDFDPGLGIMLLTSNGEKSGFVAKYSSSGNLIWAKHFDALPIDNSSAAYSLCLDASNEIFVIGEFTGMVDFDPSSNVSILSTINDSNTFIAHLDNNGNLLNVVQFEGTNPLNGFNQGNYIAYTSTNELVAVGLFSDEVDFQTGSANLTITSQGLGRDSYICKLDLNLNTLWAKAFHSTASCEINQVVTSSISGDIYLVGDYQGTTDFDPGVGVQNLISPLTSSGSDIFACKLNSQGDHIWSSGFIRTTVTGGGSWSNHGYALELNSADNPVITGRFWGTVDFDPGAGVYSLTPVGVQDAYVMQLDPQGGLDWIKTFGGNDENRALGIEIDPYDNLFVSGSFSGSTDFDPGTGTQIHTSNGSHDIFVVRLTSNGDYQWSGTSGSSSWDSALDIVVHSPSGSIYTVGGYNQTVDFDMGNGVDTETSVGDFDGYVHKMRYNDFLDVNSLNKTPQVNLFPNPARDFITVESSKSFEKITIVNSLGKVALVTSQNHVNIANLPNGIYLLSIDYGVAIESFKFVVEH